ncbi:HpcH/HpaI aldolase/citrate lyase family protein [Cytobacillus sp. NCCP-133]|uniref:HpcH/HpaI aldolase/citrate lyase family protein n=1 Tax=Cytobacillus sp. NCCP-133 TaxID=766848 RepID=UPI00222F362A|nr:CoA ester lyase [Cytobacillus sp. NCCP-133]GLB60609.1 citrate (pro-3S)-lyase subunit beta [Cytobacillus sp. NCCP-133]
MAPKRSYLFVPAISEKMMGNAVSSEADSVIFDLEDAVAINEKEIARDRAKNYLLNHPPQKDVLIRINDFTTEFWRNDIKCAVESGAKGIIVPKAESGTNMKVICQNVLELLEKTGRKNFSFEVLPLIETASGVHFSYEIANSHYLIPRLVFGSIDYSLDIDCELTDGGEELYYARSQIVNASRAAGIGSPVDAVYPDLSNEEGLKKEAVRARISGFKSKLAIHPKQLHVIHEVFTPDEKILDEAREIVKAFEEAEQKGSASISVRNKLVDYPVYKKAKGLLQYSVL